MRDLFFKLLEMSHFDTKSRVTPFSAPHLIYLFIILVCVVGGHFLLRKETQTQKEHTLRILASCAVIFYIVDIFASNFAYGSAEAPAGIRVQSLPFATCSALCILVAFAQFKKNSKIKDAVAVLAVAAPLVFLVYPLGIVSEPWCYQALQAMLFHGVLFAWGVLSISLNVVEISILKCYKPLLILGCLTLFTKLGEIMYGKSWYYINEQSEAVQSGKIIEWTLMLINPAIVFGIALVVYAIYHIVILINGKPLKPQDTSEQTNKYTFNYYR